jgi:cell division protein FtsB
MSPLRWLLPPALCLVLAVASLALDDEKGAELLLDLHRAVRAGEARVLTLEAEREGLLARIRGLRSDPLQLEVVAREKLGMVRPGELVIRWSAEAERAKR